MPETDGNHAQIRAIAKSMVEAATYEFSKRELPEARVPVPLKWAAAIVGGIMTVGSAGLLFWMVTTISVTQLTVVRIEERQAAKATEWDEKLKQLDERMRALEARAAHPAP